MYVCALSEMGPGGGGQGILRRGILIFVSWDNEIFTWWVGWGATQSPFSPKDSNKEVELTSKDFP